MSEEKNSVTNDNDITDELANALPRLTADQIAEVSPKFVRRTFSEGEVIIKQGETADNFYIVIRGQAEIWHEDAKGQMKYVARRVPGEYFGEIGLLQEKPRTATVSAPSDGEVEVLSLAHDDFEELIDDSKATEAHVARDMINRLIRLADVQ